MHPSLAEKFKSRVFLEKTINAINMTEDMKPELRTKSLWSIWMFGLEQGLAFTFWVSSIHALGCEQGSGSIQSLETAVWWDWVLVVVSSFHEPLELLHQLSSSSFISLVIPFISLQWAKILNETLCSQKSGPNWACPPPSTFRVRT